MPTFLLAFALSVPAPAPISVPVAAPTPPPELVLPPTPLAVKPVEDKPAMEYTYIEANYLWTDSDAADESLDGIELTGSLELPLNFFLQLTAAHQEADTNIDLYRIGAGWHFSLGARIDAYGLLSFAHVELDDSGASFDSDGVAGEAGVRFLLTDKIELNGALKWQDVEESDAGVALGGRFYLMDRLSLGGRIESLGNDESFAVGLRFEL